MWCVIEYLIENESWNSQVILVCISLVRHTNNYIELYYTVVWISLDTHAKVA